MEDRTGQLLNALEKFIRHVDKLKNEDDPSGNGFHREYRDLREISIENRDTIPATHGKLPHNIRKNRYKDIVPFDATRVTLSKKDGIEGSDYINANFIMDAHQREGYIASQGPLPHTLEDFWRMCDELKVKVVMMACREFEANKKKCARYWVDLDEEAAQFGPYKVDCIKQEALADDCDERHLQLITQHKIQEVFQYHYTGWPDHGIPDDIDVILAMIKRMRDIRSKDPDHAPVVVHCSAGCGRTGTICAVDYAWEILKSGQLTDDFNLFNIVKSMREQRQSMIQTPEQYEMAHLAVAELFRKHIEIMNESDYANVVIGQDNEYSNVEEVNNKDDDEHYADIQQDLKKLQLDALDTIRNYDETPETHSQHSDHSSHSKENKTIQIIDNTPSLKPKVVIEQKQMTDVKSKGYDNVFTADKYENIKPGSDSSSLESVKKLREDFEQKNSHPEVGPRFSGPNITLSSATINLPNTTDKQATQNPQTTPVNHGPLFVSPNSTTIPKVPTNDVQSGPMFVKQSSIDQSKIQDQSRPPPTGKFVSKISISSSSSTILQGNKTNNPPKMDEYELAKPIKEPTRNSLQNVTLNSDLSAVYAVPGKSSAPSTSGSGPVYAVPGNTTAPPASGVYAEVQKGVNSASTGNKIAPPTAGAVYSEVHKGVNSEHKVVPGDSAYESIAISAPAGPAKQTKHYEDVQLGAGEYSTVGELNNVESGPPIPKREYDEPEHSSDHSKSSVADKLKSKFSNTLFSSKGSSSSDQADQKTSSVPGFNQRIEKKVKGPRHMPWKKSKS